MWHRMSPVLYPSPIRQLVYKILNYGYLIVFSMLAYVFLKDRGQCMLLFIFFIPGII